MSVRGGRSRVMDSKIIWYVITAGWAAKKYVLGPAYDAAKGLWSGGEAVATAGGEALGPTLGDATSLLPTELTEVATADFQVRLLRLYPAYPLN